MEQVNTIHAIKSKFKLGFTYKELGVFFLLLFLNIKFVTITITHNRSIIIDSIVYLLFIATFNYSNWTYSSLIKTAGIIGIYTLINFSGYKLNVLLPLLVIQSVSGIRFKRYLLINFIISSSFLLLMFIIYREGISISAYSFLIERKVRMSFGFNYPNVAALNYFCLIINGLLLVHFSKYSKYVPLYLLLIIPFWYFLYIKTVSRSFLLSIIVLYGSFMYYYIGTLVNRKYLLVITRYLFIFLIFIFAFISVFFAVAHDNFTFLNKILSGRLYLYSVFLRQLTPIDFIFGSAAYKNVVIDSSFIHLLFEGGIIFFLFVCWFYILATYQMTVQKAVVPICVIISFMAYGLMETLLLYSMLIGTNIFWIILYYYYRNGKMQL